MEKQLQVWAQQPVIYDTILNKENLNKTLSYRKKALKVHMKHFGKIHFPMRYFN